MRVQGQNSLPDSVINEAVSSYLYSNNAEPYEQMVIRQVKYAEKHGDFSVDSEIVDDNLICTLNIDGEQYTSKIPLNVGETTQEVYQFGDVTFHNVELISVSFRSDFPWTNEAFVANYWAEPDDDSEDYVKDNIRILNHYHSPREITGEPPKEYAEGNYYPIDIRNFTHAKTPNPWSYASLAVMYENANLAKKVLNSDDTHMPNDRYKLTPPEDFAFVE